MMGLDPASNFAIHDIHKRILELSEETYVKVLDDPVLRENNSLAYQLRAGRWTITVGVTRQFVGGVPIGMGTAIGTIEDRPVVIKLPPNSYEALVEFLRTHVDGFPIQSASASDPQ